MVMHRKLLLLVFICLTISASYGQKADNDLEVKSVEIEFRTESFNLALEKTANGLDIPLGFTASVKHKAPESCVKPVKVSFNGKLPNLLDELVLHCPIYEWSFTDGVVSVHPIDEDEEFLRLKLASFSVTDVSHDELVKRLFETRELAEYTKKNGIQLDTTSVVIGNRVERKQEVFSNVFENCDVRSVLNYAVSSGKKRFWVVYRVSTDQSLVSVRFV